MKQPEKERSASDLERIVLGAAIGDAESLQYLRDNTRPDDFSVANGVIRNRMVSMLQEGTAVDRNTLIAALEVSGDLAKVGGAPYVRSLEGAVPFVEFDLSSYVRILRDFTVARKLIALGTKIRAEATSGVKSEEVLLQAERYLRSLGEFMDDRGTLLDVRETTEELGGTGNLIGGIDQREVIKTEWAELNDRIVGFLPGELWIIAARPSVGKSAMVGQIAYTVARSGKVVAYFSHEMKRKAVLQRLICAYGDILAEDIKRGTLSPNQRRLATQAAESLQPLPLHITDVSGRTVFEVEVELRRLQTRTNRKVDLVIIDHMQLMRGGRRNYANRTQELTEVSADLKRSAR